MDEQQNEENRRVESLSADEEKGRQDLMQRLSEMVNNNQWEDAAKMRGQLKVACEQGLIDGEMLIDTFLPPGEPGEVRSESGGGSGS